MVRRSDLEAPGLLGRGGSCLANPGVRVVVHFHITLFVSTTHPRRWKLVRFHGNVGPRHNGARVRI
jgi:hypothetical protein